MAISSVSYSPEKEQARMTWLLHKVACLPNTKIDWVVKGVVIGLSNDFSRRGVPHGQLSKVWYPNIAEQAGLSVDSVKAGISQLAKLAAIQKEVRWEEDEKTHARKKRVWVAFTPQFLVNPAELLADAPERNRGGKRMSVQCPHCGEYHPLAKRTTFTCTGCGGQIDEMTLMETIDNVPPDELDEQTNQQQHKELLEKLDTLIENADAYYDAVDIPDDVVDELGSAKAALDASPMDIAKRLSVPVEKRYGLEDEDIELLDQVRIGLYSRN
jgi:hypothetical protein